jgi:hypothetical protein
VTLKRGGTTFFTGTTDSSGNVTTDIGTTAAFDYSITKSPRLATATGTVSSPTCGGNTGIIMLPATGYQCICQCAEPVKETLHMTVGGVDKAMVWDGSGSWVFNHNPLTYYITPDCSAFHGVTPCQGSVTVTSCPPAAFAATVRWPDQSFIDPECGPLGPYPLTE